MCVGLVGWGTHHIQIPLVSDCTVEPKEKPKGERKTEKGHSRKTRASRVLTLSRKGVAVIHFSKDNQFSLYITDAFKKHLVKISCLILATPQSRLCYRISLDSTY